MAEEEPKQAEDEVPHVVVPTHSALPPPPAVNYTRPSLGLRPADNTPQQRPLSSRPEAPSGGSGMTSLGAGLAGATTFVASVIAGFLIGQWIDHRWNHAGGTPWGTLVFALLGVAAGFLNLFRVLAATDRKRDKK